MMRAVFLAGGPAPEVIDTIIVDGRFGIIMPRLEGQTLLQLARAGAVTPGEVGELLAGLALAAHQTQPPPQIPSLEDTLADLLRRHHSRIPPHIAAGALARLRRLPAATTLCHGDLHPGNVIMTADGPRLIDWLGTVRAAPAFDLAVSQVMLAEFVPLLVADPQRLQAIGAAFQTAYAGRNAAGWEEHVAAHLPLARLFALLTGSWSPVRPQVLARIAEDLRRQGNQSL